MSNPLDKKIIKNFKRRATNTRRQLHEFVKAMIAEARGAEIEGILLEQGMTPCVAREWGNAYKMHDNLLKRTMARKYRKETSAYGKKGMPYRRIMKSGVKSGRRFEFHATKGKRTYHIPAIASVAEVMEAT